MTGPAFFRVKFHDGGVTRGLLLMERRRRELRTVFRQLRKPLAASLQLAADREQDPETKQAWPARAPSTRRRAEKRASFKVTRERRRRRMVGPLRETRTRMAGTLGTLPTSVRTGARGATLAAASAVRWSGVHNEGGVVGHSSVIPARPFVAFADDFLELARERIEGFVIQGWDQG